MTTSPKKKGREPPVPFIDKISSTGELNLVFSEDVLPVPDLDMITNGTVTIESTTYPVLEITVEPGEDSDPARLTLDYEVVNQTSSSLTIQLYFSDAKFVSANADPDTLQVFIRDPEMFRGFNLLLIDSEKRVMRRWLPG